MHVNDLPDVLTNFTAIHVLLTIRRSSVASIPFSMPQSIEQWRRHGEDWGGHVPPSSLQGQFSNLSKSGEKNGGGGGTFVTSV